MRWFKSIFNGGDLLKVFSLTGLSTIIKLITSYVTVKVVAYIVGPSGIALIGQLQNFVSITTTLGAGGINNGVVKYVSEYKDDKVAIKGIIGNGFRITMLCSIVTGVILILFSYPLSKTILLDYELYYIFIFLGVSLVLLSINNFLISILNGFKEFKKYVIINVITSIVGLIFTIALVYFFDLRGALVAYVTYQSFVLFITIYLLKESEWYTKAYLLYNWDKTIIKKFLSYSLMALVTASTAPVAQLLIRGHLIKEFSITSAGYWEAMNRISGLFLLFFTSSLSVYYLPKLSETKNLRLLKREVLKAYKILIPIIFCSLFLMFLLKDIIITVLFTKDFYPIKNFFLWQLMGDFFKTASWILAFLMVAKSKTVMFIITEVLFAVSLVIISYYLVSINGVIGAIQAYFVNYLLYFITMVLYFRKLLFSN